MTNPKVSCIMITAHRREYVPRAIDCFLAQSYPYRELIIYDNGGANCRDLVPPRPGLIRYFARPAHLPEVSVGQLRNVACDLASGELIATWDDDDWSAPERLEVQVKVLAAARPRGARIAGFSSMYFFEDRKNGAMFRYDAGREDYAIGTSLLFERALWRERPFENVNVAEDNRFQEGLPVATAPAIDPILMIARVHDRSTTHKQWAGDTWTPIEDAELIERVKGLAA